MIATTIRREIEELLSDGGKRSAHLTDQTMLADTGLNSMLLAILVTRLEDALGLDPFSAFDEIEVPITLGDFIQLYENAAAVRDATVSI